MKTEHESLIRFFPLRSSFDKLSTGWKFTTIASILAIILELVYFCFALIPWGKLGVAEWAYWIQAIGSVGALAGAIYIANSESRARQKQAFIVAKLTYAGMVFRLHNIQEAAGKISKKLSEDLDPYQRVSYRSAYDLLESAGTWTPEELILLAPLENDIAVCISSAGDRIRHCKNLFSWADTNTKLEDFEREKIFNREMSEIMGTAQQLILGASQRAKVLTNTFQVRTRSVDPAS